MIITSKVPFSYIYRKIRADLLFVIIVALVINLVAGRFQDRIPEMPLSVPTFLGTAISILLSFKISQSYDRWWEARKVWGAIVNDSRSLVLQFKTFVAESATAEIRVAAYRQIAWCWILGRSLRGKDELDDLDRYLSPLDREEASTHQNKPLALLGQQAAHIKRLRQTEAVNDFGQLQLDNTLQRLCDAMGKSERINNTVFPVTYRLFLHFAIYLFVIVLSIALKNISPIYEVPLLALISAIFLLLEKSAPHLQDPFRDHPSDIPVSAIARTIEINLLQLLGEKDVPPPLKPETFYIK